MRLSSTTARVQILTAPWLGLLLPRSAAACAVCFSATEQSRQAFLGTTIFMSALPLALVGGALWWLRSRGGRAPSSSQGGDPGS
ncbi:MAG: hypothetical protein ACE5FG_09070 [Myxococcota bacterium]